MQLSAKASPHDLEEFFQKVGQVCDVKMISDRNSRRSKGIAYVEFYDENSVLPVSATPVQCACMCVSAVSSVNVLYTVRVCMSRRCL